MMMNRDDKIHDKMMEFETERLIKQLQCLDKDISMDEFQRYAKDYIKPLDELFKKIKCVQEQGLKDDICYINIYFLHSSFQKGIVELLVEAYDEKGIFDKEPISIQYSLKEMTEATKKDWVDYEKYMNSQIIQIKYSELHPYYIELAKAYMKMIKEIYNSFVPIIVYLESYQEMKVSDNIVIGFGEYGCSCVPIYGEINSNNDEDILADEVLFD